MEKWLTEFKNRMKLSDEEDDNLLEILNSSLAALKSMCGNYDVDKDVDFRSLVFERARYVYNDAVEYFSKNFSSEITRLSIMNALEEIEVTADEGEQV